MILGEAICIVGRALLTQEKCRLESFTFFSEDKCTVLTKYIASEFPSLAAKD